jgi:hypothetical protein
MELFAVLIGGGGGAKEVIYVSFTQEYYFFSLQILEIASTHSFVQSLSDLSAVQSS